MIICIPDRSAVQAQELFERSAPLETDYAIAFWARETFGEPDLIVTAERIQEELVELLAAMKSLELVDPRQIAMEFADVGICLLAAATAVGIDLGKAITEKMAINRARKWRRTGGGTGQHIKEGEE